MPSKLNKVHKHVAKKKGSKINALHENSRDALRLRKAGARDERVARTTAVRERMNQPWIERVSFIKDRLPDTLHPLSLTEIKDLIQAYINRYDEELTQLKAERRAGRPPSTRQTMLEQQIKVDAQEFTSGFWLPNLEDAETLIKLEEWSGEWSTLALLRFVRVEKDGPSKESQFPPRGAS